eukprot:12295225-Karenia_brevis.AAC.1
MHVPVTLRLGDGHSPIEIPPRVQYRRAKQTGSKSPVQISIQPSVAGLAQPPIQVVQLPPQAASGPPAATLEQLQAMFRYYSETAAYHHQLGHIEAARNWQDQAEIARQQLIWMHQHHVQQQGALRGEA